MELIIKKELDLFSSLNFEVKKYEISDPNRFYIELTNSIITLGFEKDYGPITANFYKNDSESDIFSLYAVYKFLNKDSASSFPVLNNEEDSSQLLLRFYYLIIIEGLSKVILGDFSWKKDFLEEQEIIKKAYAVLFSNKIDKKSIIYEKYESGDETWLDDVVNSFNLRGK